MYRNRSRYASGVRPFRFQATPSGYAGRFELLRHARVDQHGRAERIVRIERGKRAIEHIDRWISSGYTIDQRGGFDRSGEIRVVGARRGASACARIDADGGQRRRVGLRVFGLRRGRDESRRESGHEAGHERGARPLRGRRVSLRMPLRAAAFRSSHVADDARSSTVAGRATRGQISRARARTKRAIRRPRNRCSISALA
jgi:hypothetical protein